MAPARSTGARQRFNERLISCFWQLQLAHFGILIWPTPGVDVSGHGFGFPAVYIRKRRRSCGNVESPPLLRGFRGQWERREACFWLSAFSTDRHFHSFIW